MKTYRQKKYIPFSMAREYLLNDYRVINKISTLFVNYDDFPISINDKENSNADIKVEAFSKVLDSEVPRILHELSKDTESSFFVKLVVDKNHKKTDIFPVDEIFDFPDTFVLDAQIVEDDIRVLKMEVVNIRKRWNLYYDDNVLDTPYPSDDVENEEFEVIQELKQNDNDPIETESENPKKDGRKTRHLYPREEILGAAFILALYHNKDCRNSNKRVTSNHIIDQLIINSEKLWPKREKELRLNDKLGIPIPSAATKLITEYLTKWKNLDNRNEFDQNESE